MKTLETDVLISGAGAAGLTLAIRLAEAGIAFRLIDKLPAPFGGSRGKGIQPRSQEIFEDLGLLDRLAAVGAPYPAQRHHAPDGSHADRQSFEVSPPVPGEPYRTGLLVPQFLTEAAMRARLHELGHRPAFGCALTGVAQDASGVTATLRAGDTETTLRARYLVGADGGRSFVRHALAFGFPGKTLGARAIVADVALRGLNRDVWHWFAAGDMTRQICFCPLPGTALFQIQAPIPLEGAVDLSAAGLGDMARLRTGRDDIVVDRVNWASAYGMNARLADHYRAGRVFLIGDAAHIHPPTGGQGLNTGVQDGYNLSWKLAAVLRGAPETLLDTYEAERRPIAASMLALSGKLLEEARAGQHRRGREVQQLDLGYRGSALSLDLRERSGRVGAGPVGAGPVGAGPVRSGDRAPDAPVLGAAGQRRRLFDLFRGCHWTLLGVELTPEQLPQRSGVRGHSIGAGGDLRDDLGHMRAAYGCTPGDLILVRPDGYVGAIVDRHHHGALAGYLDRVLVAS